MSIAAKKKVISRKASTKTVDPEMELEGNQKLNQIKKKQFKKEKKKQARRDKVAQQLSAGLENFSLKNGPTKEINEDYDFNEDFVVKQ